MLIPLAYIEAKSLCYTYSHFALVCPACGITRAFSALMHGKISLAFNYNLFFTVAIMPICTLIFCQDIIIIIHNFLSLKKKTSLIEWILGVKNDIL